MVLEESLINGITIRVIYPIVFSSHNITILLIFAPVTHGVPQGFILGPSLFLIYIIGLILLSNKFEYIMHADDATLIYTQPKLNNVEDNVNNELRCISNWFKANKLLLNLKKTNFFVFNNNCRDMSTLENISLAFDSFPVSKVNVNFLGIHKKSNR